MGYFSNGTEGMMYEDAYCNKCEHNTEDGCPIWLAHIAFNYRQKKEVEEILNMLIPREGISNGKCVMYIDAAFFRDVATPPLPFDKE